MFAPQLTTTTGVTIKDFSLVDDLINLDALFANIAGDPVTNDVLAGALANGVIDGPTNSVEIDLDQFAVEDPETSSNAFIDGKLRIEFTDASSVAAFDEAFIKDNLNYLENNPVASEQWWQDLMNEGGFTSI